MKRLPVQGGKGQDWMKDVADALVTSGSTYVASPTMLRSATASTAKYTNAAEINRA